MSKLILIDHSLAGHGGHHFECARWLLLAAEKSGLATVTATHVDFRPSADWPVKGPVYPTFHQNAYTRQSVITGTAELPVDPFRPRKPVRRTNPWWRRPSDWHESLRLALRMRRMRRRIQREVEAATRFWEKTDASPGDHAFLQTISDFDLHWICRFLAAVPSTRNVTWHWQFHNNFLRGREPDYSTQSLQLQAMRDHFQSLLAMIPGHRVQMYCTTSALAAQFNLLGVAPFRVLECPVSPELWRAATDVEGDLFTEINSRSRDSIIADATPKARTYPLKVVCGGYGRDEKGWRQLDRLMAGVWDELFESGRCQLQVQATQDGVEKFIKKPKNYSAERDDISPYADVSRVVVEQLQSAFPQDLRRDIDADSETLSPPSLRCVPYPLSSRDYVEFVRGADVGLFLYDPTRYYSRYSAVLAEMMCVGVPVIVPAASWLADQVAEPNEEYLAGLLKSSSALRAGWVSQGSRSVEFSEVPGVASDLLVQFAWDEPLDAGEFLRVTFVQRDSAGHMLRSTPVVARPAEGTTTVHCLVPLVEAARSVALEWGGAFTESARLGRVVDAKFLPRRADGDGHHPRGAVGLVFSEPEQVGEMLREMTSHIEHYSMHAQRLASVYRRRRSPQSILECLTSISDVRPLSETNL
ncbi:MAG: hypothetical protein U1A77_02810 [Pirellulales bacterium]